MADTFILSYKYQISGNYLSMAGKIARETNNLRISANENKTSFVSMGRSISSSINEATINIKNKRAKIISSLKNVSSASLSMKKKFSANMAAMSKSSHKESKEISSDLAKIGRSFSQAGKRLNQTLHKANKSSQKTKQSIRNEERVDRKSVPLRTVGVLAATGVAASLPTAKSLELERVMIDLKKIASFKSPKEYEKFKNRIIDTSFYLGQVPSDLGEIAVEGAKLAIPVEKLGNFVDLVGRVSTSFDMIAESAGESVAGIKTKFGIGIPEVGMVMDSINYLADRSATTGKNITEVLGRTVGTWSQLKMPPEIASAWSAFAAQMEHSPEIAASSINMMMSRISSIPGLYRKVLRDPNKGLLDIFDKISKMRPIQKSKYVKKIFGDEAGRFVGKATGRMELLRKTIGLVADKTNFAGSMQDELNKKLAGAPSAVDRMKSSFDIMMITIGDHILPMLKKISPLIVDATKDIRTFVKSNPEIVDFGLAFAGVAAGVAAVGVAVSGIVFGLGAMANPAVAIIAGVASIVTGMTYMYQNSERIKKSFSDLSNEITPLSESLKDLFGEFNWEDNEIDFFSFFEKAISSSIDDLVYDIRNLKKVYRGMVKLFNDPVEALGLSGIGEKVKSTLNIIPRLINPFGRFNPFSPAISKDSENINSNYLDANINVNVKAEPGSSVTGVNFKHNKPNNIGLNMTGAWQD